MVLISPTFIRPAISVAGRLTAKILVTSTTLGYDWQVHQHCRVGTLGHHHPVPWRYTHPEGRLIDLNPTKALCDLTGFQGFEWEVPGAGDDGSRPIHRLVSRDTRGSKWQIQPEGVDSTDPLGTFLGVLMVLYVLIYVFMVVFFFVHDFPCFW